MDWNIVPELVERKTAAFLIFLAPCITVRFPYVISAIRHDYLKTVLSRAGFNKRSGHTAERRHVLLNALVVVAERLHWHVYAGMLARWGG
jgi:hypothetical protein